MYNSSMIPSVEQLWSTLSGRLLAFIRSRVEDEATAEDLLQEVFLRIHQHMRDLTDSQRIEAWVYQIARNAIIDYYRRRRVTAPVDDAIPDEERLFDEPDAAGELLPSVREWVEALPEPYREALVLTEFEGLTLKDAAERVGISLPGMKSRVQRARQKIKDDLLRCCHFEFDRYGRVVDFWQACCCCTQAVASN